MIVLTDKFRQDTLGANLNVVPMVVIDNSIYISQVKQTFSNGVEDVYWQDLNLKINSIKESVDFENRKFKISNVTLTLSNYLIDNQRFSDRNYINKEVQIYWKSQSCETLEDCLLVYQGIVRRFNHNTEIATLQLEDWTEKNLHKEVPISRLGDGDDVLEKYKNQPYPMVYGEVDKAPTVILPNETASPSNFGLTVDKEDYVAIHIDNENDIEPEELHQIKVSDTLHIYEGDGWWRVPENRLAGKDTYYDNSQWESTNDTIIDLVNKNNTDDEDDYAGNGIGSDVLQAYQKDSPISVALFGGTHQGVNSQENQGVNYHSGENEAGIDNQDYDYNNNLHLNEDGTANGGVSDGTILDLPDGNEMFPLHIHSDGSHLQYQDKGYVFLISQKKNQDINDVGDKWVVTPLFNFKPFGVSSKTSWLQVVMKGTFFVFNYGDGNPPEAYTNLSCGIRMASFGGNMSTYSPEGWDIQITTFDRAYHDVAGLHPNVEALNSTLPVDGNVVGYNRTGNFYDNNNDGFTDTPAIFFDLIKGDNQFSDLSSYTNIGTSFYPLHETEDWVKLGFRAEIEDYYRIGYADFEGVLEKDYYVRTNGRELVGENGSPPLILKDLFKKELLASIGDNNMTEAIQEHSDWKLGFSVKEKTDSKKLVEDIAKSTKLLPTFKVDNTLGFTTIKNSYSWDDVDAEIANADIINYSFSRTEIEKVKTRVKVFYKKNYGSDDYDESTDWLYAEEQLNDYHLDYFGLNANEDGTEEEQHPDSSLEFESDYIRDEATALALQEFLLYWNCNQHTKFKLTLPLNYLNLEVGDIIRFDAMLDNMKAYGEDYVNGDESSNFSGTSTRNGQVIYPAFMVTSLNKNPDKIEVEAMQLHYLGNGNHLWQNEGSEGYIVYGCMNEDAINYNANATEDNGSCRFRDGDINNDGIVNVGDIILMINHIMDVQPLTGLDLEVADMNNDGILNIQDIIEIINSIIGGGDNINLIAPPNVDITVGQIGEFYQVGNYLYWEGTVEKYNDGGEADWTILFQYARLSDGSKIWVEYDSWEENDFTGETLILNWRISSAALTHPTPPHLRLIVQAVNDSGSSGKVVYWDIDSLSYTVEDWDDIL